MHKLDHRQSSSASTVPFVIGACVLWASAFPVIKIGLRLEYAGPLTFAGLRFILAGCMLLPFCGGLGALRAAIAGHWRLIALVSALQTVMLYSMFFLGMNIVSGAQGAIVSGASPLVAAVLAHWMMADDRMTAGKFSTIMLGMAGVAIIALATKPWQPTGRRELLGMALVLGGTTSSAMSAIVVARNRRPVNPLILNSLQMGLGGMVLLAIGMNCERLPTSLPPRKFLTVLAWLATISAVGFSTWFWLLKREKVSRLSMWKFLLPALGVILSWMFVPGEGPQWVTGTGMVCVAAAVLLNQLLVRRLPAEAASEGSAGEISSGIVT
ncbi:MAG: DMT family transporter [Planctomycetes bacterium]|nr:DMT family transporter [Planctomycetota bacterium]